MARQARKNRLFLHCENSAEYIEKLPAEVVPIVYNDPTLTIISTRLIDSALRSGYRLEEIRERSDFTLSSLSDIKIDYTAEDIERRRLYPDKILHKLIPAEDTRVVISKVNEFLEILFPRIPPEQREVPSRVVVARTSDPQVSAIIRDSIVPILPLSLVFGDISPYQSAGQRAIQKIQ